MALAAPRQQLTTAPVVRQRLTRLDEPHVHSLNAFAKALGQMHAGVPFFDPDGGGVRARILLLLSDPGANGAQVTRIASVDNPDKTARNLTRMLAEAKLDPRDTVNWNIVPWATSNPFSELDAGMDALRKLLPQLTALRVVVAMGTKARHGWARLRQDYPGLRTCETWHPAQRGGAANETEIVAALRLARRMANLR